MRNIKIVEIKKQSPFPSQFQSESAIFSLGDHGTLYICSDGRLSRFSEDGQATQVICRNEELLGDATLIQYLSTTGIIYVGNKRGSFLQFMLHGTEVEELFQSDQGIANFAVSPDSRYVAIATKQGTLLLLTLPDLETLSQVELFGTEGDENQNELTKDDIKIVWREDSHYFAVNYLHNKKFQIKIFEETGALHSSIEEENQLLDSTLEWQPSGGLVAAVGTTPHGTVVSLFERNGLKRADFHPYEGKTESYQDNPVKSVLWNASSDILSLIYQNKVELWSRNNYVWMRKAVINRGAVYVAWDRERYYRLHIIDLSGTLYVYDVAFVYTSGYSGGSAMVSSWNGSNVYTTPFRSSCCPPPQCLFQVKADDEIKTVVIPEFWDGLLSLTQKGQLVFWQCDSDELKQLRKVTIPNFEQLEHSYDWIWPNRNTICCISNEKLMILELEGSLEDLGSEMSVSIKESPLNMPIVSTFPFGRRREESNILLQTKLYSILKLDLTTGVSTLQCKFPQMSTSVQTIADSIIVAHDPLTRKLMIGWGKYPECDPLVLNSDCTSFAVFENSLIYTRIQGFLEIKNCDHLHRLVEKHYLGKEFIEDESLGTYTRKCEKGSEIVTCCLNQMMEPSLVLQIIPRGNLEIIYPRPLVVDVVKVMMREEENNTRYEKIMSALRRHRIDYRVLIDEMRILIDQGTSYRLEELLKTMVDQVKNSHSLVLLITDLNHDYSDCISIIKNVLEGVLVDNAEKRLIHVEESYLAAMAKLGLLEDALKSSLILGEGDGNRELVQHRVKFLSFYCENPDILFDTALGTYDLSLASLVADCLGKDPKEYLPVLNELQTMIELKRRFRIDDKLRRYNKAVIHLIRNSRIMHEEIVKYMERHRLFTDVIGFLTRKLKNDEGGIVERSGEDTALLWREAQSSYAMYLEERGKLLEASILFRNAVEMDKSIDCCVKSGNWEFALEMAFESGKTRENVEGICKKALAYLEEKKMFSDAARLCENYLGDLEQTVHFLIRDKKWQHASTLSLKSPSLGKGFRDENVKPKLLEACREQKEVLEQMTDEMQNKLIRLRIVKEMKAEKLAETGFGDSFSDTESYISGSSVSGSISSSNMSGKSYRSGKNKRKLERKVYSMKEGSKYEDLGITAHLWTVMEKIQNETKPDVSNTIESLWKFDEGDAAMDICGALEVLLQTANNCIGEVWCVPIQSEILETKFRFPLANWNPVLTKLALHDTSSKASAR